MNKIDVALLQLEGVFRFKYGELFNDLFYAPIEIETPNKELKTLYEWRNGNAVFNLVEKGEFEFCPFGYFLPHTVAAHYVEEAKELFTFNDRLYFPIISNYKGDYLLVEANSKCSAVYIISPSLMIVEPLQIYRSIGDMIFVIFDCYERNVYRYDERFLEIDFEKEVKIVKKFDDSPFWDE